MAISHCPNCNSRSPVFLHYKTVKQYYFEYGVGGLLIDRKPGKVQMLEKEIIQCCECETVRKDLELAKYEDGTTYVRNVTFKP